jgi:3-oxoacyl-[acyl-carrier protein] reductase
MKTIAVFGGTGGLGSQLCGWLEKGYEKVIAIGSNDVDVTSYEEVKNFFDTHEIDIVINLSGYNYDKFVHKLTAEDMSEVSKQLDINIQGTINVTNCALTQMRERSYGRLILVSSVLADHPVISTGVYAGCKGFVDSFTKTVALENAGKNISCNSLQLGYFDGGLTFRIPEQFRDKIVKNIPAQRWGSIQELYNTVDYLIKTPYITGQNINISGGII